jgi:hypothetical protein
VTFTLNKTVFIQNQLTVIIANDPPFFRPATTGAVAIFFLGYGNQSL